MVMSKKKADKNTVGSAPQSAPPSGKKVADGSEEPSLHDVASDIEAKLTEEVAHWKDFAMRAQAEFANTKDRLVKQQATALAHAGERVISELIPVMDDLEYGIAHAKETGNELAEGLEAIYAKMRAVFEGQGVSVLDPTGEAFDHNTASAVQMVKNADLPDQTVSQTLQKGYVLGTKVLRPAMVVVSTGGPARA